VWNRLLMNTWPMIYFSVSNYDFIDTIHNVPVGTNDSHGLTNYSNDTHGLTNYDYDGMVVMSEFGHEPFKSPRGSYAHTVQTATTGTTTRQKYRVLGTLTLVGIVYFAVSRFFPSFFLSKRTLTDIFRLYDRLVAAP
jgi:hypothetical protein